jgi:glucose-1-phosphate adenylyltransferase
VRSCLISEGTDVLGNVHGSILGTDVLIDKGAHVYDSIIMENSIIGVNAELHRCIVDTRCKIGDNVVIGLGADIINVDKPQYYDSGITVLGEDTVIPDGVSIGKNCVVYGKTTIEDYPSGRLESGQSIIKPISKEGAVL